MVQPPGASNFRELLPPGHYQDVDGEAGRERAAVAISRETAFLSNPTEKELGG